MDEMARSFVTEYLSQKRGGVQDAIFTCHMHGVTDRKITFYILHFTSFVAEYQYVKVSTIGKFTVPGKECSVV